MNYIKNTSIIRKCFTLSFVCSILLITSFQSVFGAALEETTSGVRDADYTAIWCPAHTEVPFPGSLNYDLEDMLNGERCYKGKLNKLGGNLYLNSEGVGMSWDIFENIVFNEAIPFMFRHEGTLTIKSLLVDNADNVSVNTMVYKVDKTAPKFPLLTFTENSPYLNIETSEEKPDIEMHQAADRFDITYPNHSIYGYRENENSLTQTINYSNYTLCPEGYSWYYDRCSKSLLSTISKPWSGTPPTGEVLDVENTYLSSSEISQLNAVCPIPGVGMNGPYLEGQGIASNQGWDIPDLRDQWFLDKGLSQSETLYFRYYWARPDGTLAFYCVESVPSIESDAILPKIRYKDVGTNAQVTVDLTSVNDDYGHRQTAHISGLGKLELYRGSYESATPITMGSNGFSPEDFGRGADTTGTGEVIRMRQYDNAGNYGEQAFEVYRDESKPDPDLFTFTFPDGEDLLLSGTDSKFMLANTTSSFNYDWGTAESNDHMAEGIQFKVENTNTPTTLDQIATLTSISGSTTPDFNLSKVDNNLESGNFRNYSVEFETPGIDGNNICDVVGNCVPGEDILTNLRVIAGKPFAGTSKIGASTNTSKILANGTDFYTLNYSLKDQYFNAVTPVSSSEGTIRNVESLLSFNNTLTEVTIDIDDASINSLKSLSNPVKVTGLNGSSSHTINSNGRLILKETVSGAKGEFSFNLASDIPTSEGYNFMKNGFNLSLNSTENTIQDTLSYVHNGAVGTSVNPIFGTTLLSSIFSIEGNIEESKDQNYNLSSSLTSYGTVTPNVLDNTWAQINGKRLNFEFASPFVYHAEDFYILRDGIDTTHKKIRHIGSFDIKDLYFAADNSANTKANFYVGNTLKNNLSDASIGLNKVKYDAVEGSDFKDWGYVSYIKSNGVYLPSISRGVKPIVADTDRYQSSAYYSNVSIDTGAIYGITQDIAVTGLIGDKGGANTDSFNDVRFIDSSNIGRAELMQKFKKNVFKLAPKASTNCTNKVITNFNSIHDDCKISTQSETLYFFTGNTTVSLTSNVEGRKAIIVRDGVLTIQEKIITEDADDKLFLGVITDKGLSDVSRVGGKSEHKGWLYIDDSVRNIDAFLLSQGPVVSSFNGEVINDFSNEQRLLDQLYIRGSVFSLNTIGGSKTNECPYIERTSCLNNSDLSQVYDLSFLRRFGYFEKTNEFGDTSIEYYGGGEAAAPVPGETELKEKFLKAPVIVERDPTWTQYPSVLSLD